MNKIVNAIKGLIIIIVSIIYLYFGRFITIIIGMFLSAFRWDDMNVFLSFILYIEQLYVMVILTWYIFKERDIIRWSITAIWGVIVLSFMIVYESVIPIIEQIRFYFYDYNIIIDYIILIIMSFLSYWVLPSSRFKKKSEDKVD